MHSVKVIGLNVLLLVISGCGTTGPTATYDGSENQTVYESEAWNVGQLESALGSGSTIVMRAVASCVSRNCTPRTIQLVLAIQGERDPAMRARRVSIVADGTEYSWEGGNRNVQRELSIPGEPVLKAELSLSAVTQIANASTVSARLGNTPLNLEGQAQSRLRSFVQFVQNPSAAGTSFRRACRPPELHRGLRGLEALHREVENGATCESLRVKG